jgi:hypothetical protein
VKLLETASHLLADREDRTNDPFENLIASASAALEKDVRAKFGKLLPL